MRPVFDGQGHSAELSVSLLLSYPCRNLSEASSAKAKRAVFEILGIAGITISMLAYVPQVVHLGKQHCSAGISRRAWAMWLVASLLVGAVAVHRGDLVFITLQLSTLTSAAIILILAHKYRGRVCATHAADPSSELTATGRASAPEARAR
jgi:lipid-A-disaccharide synthase-like uncharacterized protein